MFKWKRCVVMLLVVSLFGLSSAQGQRRVRRRPGPRPVKPVSLPVGPPAGNVLMHVPSGCMGFVVVNNIQNFTGKIDAFLKQISPPDQPIIPGKVLDLICAQAKLAEGFNPNGGFAAVMLDPQQYGVDLVSMIDGEQPGDAVQKKMPVILIVPTTDKTMTKMLAGHEPVKEGNYVKLGRGPTYCMVKGNYALLGPNLKAVRNVAAGIKPVLLQLSSADKALVARNDVAVWVNFKMLAPILDAAIVKIEKKMAEAKGGGGRAMRPTMPGKMMFHNLSSAREIIKQVSSASAGLRIGKTGIMIEGRGAFLADSMMGKVLAAYKPMAGSLLNRLPNMPYVLAFGARNEPKAPRDFNIKQINNLLANEPFAGLSADAKAKCLGIMLGLEDQIQATQVYLGGITTGNGQVGMACVLECKSAEKVKAMLVDGVAVAGEIIQTVKDEDFRKLSVKYHKSLEVAGGKKVDVISIDHPEINSMEEADRDKMKAILGEDKIRLLIASTDPKTLVITIGGGKGFLTEAIKTAAGRTGRLHMSPEAAKALAMLPRQRMAVGLFNVGNIFTIIKNISAAIGEEQPPIPPITAKEPFVGSMSIKGNAISFNAYLPTKTVGEVTKAFMGLLMMRMGPGPGPGPMVPVQPVPPPGAF